jgi:hypothetical protein
VQQQQQQQQHVLHLQLSCWSVFCGGGSGRQTGSAAAVQGFWTVVESCHPLVLPVVMCYGLIERRAGFKLCCWKVLTCSCVMFYVGIAVIGCFYAQGYAQGSIDWQRVVVCLKDAFLVQPLFCF